MPFGDFLENPCDDEPRVDWHTVVVQQRNQLILICIDIVNQQRAKLRVAILLDNIDNVVIINKIAYGVRKRKGLDAAVVETDIPGLKAVKRFLACAVATAKRQNGCLIEF